MSAELFAVIDCNGSGDNTIVPAVGGPNQVIRVLSYMMVSAGTVVATWKSGLGGSATKLAGGLPLIASSGAGSPPGPHCPGGRAAHMETKPGEALNLNLSAGVQVSGHLTYEARTI